MNTTEKKQKLVAISGWGRALLGLESGGYKLLGLS